MEPSSEIGHRPLSASRAVHLIVRRQKDPMPRSETVLQVFVASPDDVAEERAALEELVREFNSTWARTLGVRLELVRWETDAVPGFGEDPQDVVNQTMPMTYDIFIGIMWTRVGTPTSRAGSGTIEEFERAHARFKADPNSVQILLYFKDEPVSPSKIDPIQFAEVSKFRGGLGPLGGLYWAFTTTADFQSFVRVHLSRVVQKWTTQTGSNVQAAPEPASAERGPEPTRPEYDDEGFIDLIEGANEALTRVNQVVERMTQAMGQLDETIGSRSSELNSAKDKSGQADLKAVKRIIGSAAEDLEEWVKRTAVDAPVFAEQLKRGVTAYGKAALIANDFGEEGAKQLTDALNTLRTFRPHLSDARGHLSTFRESVAGTPRMTTAYNHAKRKALETLSSLLNEYEMAEQLVREVEKSLEALVVETS